MISFWLVALGVPLIVVVANSLIRLMKGLAQSAPADLVLALTVFNFAVVVQSQDFQKFIRVEAIKSDLVAVYCALIIFSLFCWFFSVFYVEEYINSYWEERAVASCPTGCARKKNSRMRFPIFRYFLTLMIPAMNIFGSLSPFVVS